MAGERTSDGRIPDDRNRSPAPHWPVLLLLAAFLIVCLVWSRAVAGDNSTWPKVSEQVCATDNGAAQSRQ